ncbi:protein SGT1 homolog [Amphibalanus amphitrite]|uniref:protein SGT1 homolog n=1 Tax=Amphibalanus amphitrite TaxID=1232801 RepID=UPI001C922067|nr:protein SGT1 homolog [Amphibalanus amphitrite]XP_043218298.1 protein SGT1 homolog [Amphibalanus amphitrite]
MSGEGVSRIKYDWYQTDQDVVINILAKSLSSEAASVKIECSAVEVNATLPTGSPYSLQLHLLHPVVPDSSSWRVLPSKLEIKLRKAEAYRWAALEGSGEPPSLRTVGAGAAAAGGGGLPSPYARPPAAAARDWDAIAAELRRQEEQEKPEGEEALNSLFQKIYADGSDDVKKAMAKSFTESGGTVLSTNWNDIGKKKTEVKSPDGMEFKKWES